MINFLSDYAELVRGKTYESALCSGSDGIPLLGLGAIEREGGFKSSFKRYQGDTDPRTIVNGGDLFFSLKDLTQAGHLLGSVARLPESIPQGRLTQDTLKLSLSEIDPTYVYWVLRSPQARRFYKSLATGTTNLGLAREDFLSLPIPPLTAERKFTVELLERIESKIELNQKMNQTLEDIAKAIFKSWFVDFDPVRAKAEDRPTGLPAEISDLFPDAFEDSEIGGIPLGWKVSPLDSIGTFKNGLALQKYPPIEGSERLPVVKIAQLRKGSTIGDDTYASGVPDGFVIDDGDFVFSWSGTLMAKYWVGGRGALNQHLFKVEGQTQPLWMVAGWVAHFMPEFQSIAASKATTMGHIQREHLRQALCIIPPTDVVDASSAIMTPIVERCILAQQESKVLLELRDTLLPKLISGELRIPDAEKFLEEAGI